MAAGFNSMTKLIDRPLIKKPTPVSPEHLAGDLIQSGHPLFGLVDQNVVRFAGGGPDPKGVS